MSPHPNDAVVPTDVVVLRLRVAAVLGLHLCTNQCSRRKTVLNLAIATSECQLICFSVGKKAAICSTMNSRNAPEVITGYTYAQCLHRIRYLQKCRREHID